MRRNSLANTIKTVAHLVFFIGFIIGIFTGYRPSLEHDLKEKIYIAHHFNIMKLLYWWVGSFLWGLMMLGVSEALFLLYKILGKLTVHEKIIYPYNNANYNPKKIINHQAIQTHYQDYIARQNEK